MEMDWAVGKCPNLLLLTPGMPGNTQNQSVNFFLKRPVFYFLFYNLLVSAFIVVPPLGPALGLAKSPIQILECHY